MSSCNTMYFFVAKHSSASLNFQSQRNELYPGDYLQIEIEVDPSFKEDEYKINWIYTDTSSPPLQNGKKFALLISEQHVQEDFTIYCTVPTTNRNWHRLNDCDDRISITYRVLPPVEDWR